MYSNNDQNVIRGNQFILTEKVELNQLNFIPEGIKRAFESSAKLTQNSNKKKILHA